MLLIISNVTFAIFLALIPLALFVGLLTFLPAPAQPSRRGGIPGWFVNVRHSWSLKADLWFRAHVVFTAIAGLVIGYVSSQPTAAYESARATITNARTWPFYVGSVLLTLALVPAIPLAMFCSLVGKLADKLTPAPDPVETAFYRQMREAIERTERAVQADGGLASETNTLADRIVEMDKRSRSVA